MILWAVFVDWPIVDAHPQHICVLLGDQHWVGYPGGFLCLSDELGVEQSVDFFPYRLALGLGESSQRLPHWLRVRLDAQCVLCELARYPWHIGWAPGEDFPLLAKKGDEGSGLFFREVSVDAGCFPWVRWVHLVGECVAVDTEISSVFLRLASAC